MQKRFAKVCKHAVLGRKPVVLAMLFLPYPIPFWRIKRRRAASDMPAKARHPSAPFFPKRSS